MITELGLLTCADTIVGGPLIKGISGGERKRTSVGVELVVVSSFFVSFGVPVSHLDSPLTLLRRPTLCFTFTPLKSSETGHGVLR
jgi:hypothetical protein